MQSATNSICGSAFIIYVYEILYVKCKLQKLPRRTQANFNGVQNRKKRHSSQAPKQKHNFRGLLFGALKYKRRRECNSRLPGIKPY